jgi:tetratricopeptide (TPR) repeat protein
VSSENLEVARKLYSSGKAAFERGQYRQSVQDLEKAVSLLEQRSRFGGEVQIWLVIAYEAADQRTEAIALCEQVSKHPDLDTRKQGKRLLYILKAPRLQIKSEWLTQIPDLTNLDEAETVFKAAQQPKIPRSPRPPRPPAEPEPVDLSKVNTKDNAFVWIALVAIALIAGYLFWLS